MSGSGSWDIDPAGVQGVLTTVATHAKTLSDAATSMGTHLETAGTSCGSKIVGQALSDFVTTRMPELTKAANTITSAANGTVTAVKAYQSGDLQMAANAQTTAANGQ